MNIMKKSLLSSAIRNSVVASTGLMSIFLVHATQAGASDSSQVELLEEVVVTGSRRAPRSVFDSAAPIDVVSGSDFVHQGETDLSSLLRNVVPSYNVNTQSSNNASNIVRPANMRGLAPDHTLILVKGNRRHRAAVITWVGSSISNGSQGVDVSAIPAIALKQVEVLRDGAAAQYGSDAIAGVMNFILKDDSEGGSIDVRYGETGAGDGENMTISANVGLPFTSKGFINLSGEYGRTGATDRGNQVDEAAALIAEGNTAVKNPAQIWGQPELNDDLKLAVNMGLEVADGIDFYASGIYASKEVDGSFFFRSPDSRGGVFVDHYSDGHEEGFNIDALRLVFDTTADGSGACGDVRVFNDDGTKNVDGLNAVMANPSCFVFNEWFPGGFNPRFGANTSDVSGTAGVRGANEGGLNWDVSLTVGQNKIDYLLYESVNASYGPKSPTSFNPGITKQLDKTFNVDLSYPIAVSGFASDLNVAGGFEWRNEQYQAISGDSEGWLAGPYTAFGESNGPSTVSNGFPGIAPQAAGTFSRTNVALYLDLEADVTDNLLLGAALRWEDYDSFGSTVTGKVAAHWELSDVLALRATYSTGFRAPTPGQANASDISTQFSGGELVEIGTIPSEDPLAMEYGGEVLEPETSKSYTMGAIVQVGNFSVTADYFNIVMEDRLALTQDFRLTDADRARLQESGVISGDGLASFRFFTNDFGTTTKGIDIVATYSADVLGGSTDLSLAYNRTENKVDSYSPDVISQERIDGLEGGVPKVRWNVSATHYVNDWRLMVRASYYGSFYDKEDETVYGKEILLDAEAEYTFNENYSVTLGAQNLLDEYPDLSVVGNWGRKYPQAAPIGFAGGLYYAKMAYKF